MTIRKDYDKAEQLYQRAIEIDPNYAIALNNYGILLKETRKDNDKAERFFQTAIEIDPDYASALDNYANFLKQNSQRLR